MAHSIDYRLTANSFEKLRAEKPQLFIYSVGYEERSNYARTLIKAKRSAAFLYNSHGRISYDSNHLAFVENGDIGLHIDLSNLDTIVAEASKSEDDGRIHAVLDISCLNRSLIAGALAKLIEMRQIVARISIVYVPAKFEEPDLYMVPAQYFGPAIPALAGNVGEPYKERCLIMGLGYEYGAALSAIEIIEPDRGFYFHPIGRSSKYEPAVKAANFNFDFGIGDYIVKSYNIEDPIALHGMLRDIIESYIDRGTITIVPFGPKIFSSVTSILALKYPQHISLLRYSLASVDTARNARADKYVVAYDINLSF